MQRFTPWQQTNWITPRSGPDRSGWSALILWSAAGVGIGVSALVLPWPEPVVRALASGFTLLPALASLLVLLRGWPYWSGTERTQLRLLGVVAGLVLGVALGLGWGAAAMQSALATRISDRPGDHAEQLRVRVLEEPLQTPARGAMPSSQRFLALVLVNTPPAHGRAPNRVGARIRLSWNAGPTLAPGDVLAVAVRLRAPRGQANVAGFDAERWLLANGIDGTGTVLRGTVVDRQPAAGLSGWISAQRSAIAAFIRETSDRHAGVLAAQIVGQVEAIPESDWAIFRATGTVHLMVISGLHITLAAALGAVAGRLLACCVPWLLPYLHAGWLGAAGGVLVAIAAVLLAGGGVAIVRAVLMALPALLLRALGFRTSLLRSLLVALWVLLVTEPRAVLGSGLWFSTGAVAVLALLPVALARGSGSGPRGQADRLPLMEGLSTLLRAEVALTLALAPLQVALTGAWPIAGLPANLVAVPVMTLVVTPLVLLAGGLRQWAPDAARLLLALAAEVFDWLARGLAALARWPELHGAPDAPLLLLGLAGGLGLLLVRRWQHRALMALAASVVLLPGGQRSEAAPLPVGQFRVTAIDVGQGDAILVDTARHRLLFDTGPGFTDGRDRVMTHIMPVLAATGRPALDLVLLSHADLDHTGGLGTLLGRVSVDAWLGALPPASEVQPADAGPMLMLPIGSRTGCHGRQWRWDGVVFRLEARIGASSAHRVSPATRIEAGSNDDSCVLLIDNGHARALLPGDISARIEMALLGVLVGPLELLVAPHHGSQSSSSRAFVRRLQPRTVWISAGHGNRYGHPHPTVCARYAAQGSRVFVTAASGALTWRSDRPGETRIVRQRLGPYWRLEPTSEGGCS